MNTTALSSSSSRRAVLAALTLTAFLGTPIASLADTGDTGPGRGVCHATDSAAPRLPGLAFIDYRHLGGGADGVALIDLDPESAGFGRILQRRSIGVGALPHHLYFNRAENRLYTTSLGGRYLYEIALRCREGVPSVAAIRPVDTGANQVGEDMYFTEDGRRYYVTFMGGQGGSRDGSVGVFDARSNRLIRTIVAPMPPDPQPGQPFLLYPHGISANEALGVLMVTSTIHPDLTTGVGNTVTTIDLATGEPRETYLVSESPDVFSSPVEVLLTRGGLPPFALVTTMLGGDIWVASYDPAAGRFAEFSKQIEGDDTGVSWPLEFYIHVDAAGEPELYVSFAAPGVVNVYSLANLPQLTLKRTLPAGAGAHHMTFFHTRSGREVVAVQNNLLNLPGLNSGLLTVLDISSGEVLGVVNLPQRYGLMPESIESAYGSGHDGHH